MSLACGAAAEHFTCLTRSRGRVHNITILYRNLAQVLILYMDNVGTALEYHSYG